MSHREHEGTPCRGIYGTSTALDIPAVQPDGFGPKMAGKRPLAPPADLLAFIVTHSVREVAHVLGVGHSTVLRMRHGGCPVNLSRVLAAWEACPDRLNPVSQAIFASMTQSLAAPPKKLAPARSQGASGATGVARFTGTSMGKKQKSLPPLVAKAFADLKQALDMSVPANLGEKFPFYVKGDEARPARQAGGNGNRVQSQLAPAGPNPANLDKTGKRYVLAGCMVELPDLAMARVGRVENGRWWLPCGQEPHPATCNEVRVLMRTFSESMGSFYWA